MKESDMNILIIGAGGHARSVMDIILRNGEYRILGCTDKHYGERSSVEFMEDIAIIGSDDMLGFFYEKGTKKAFVALGNNDLRERIYNKAKAIGFEMISIISRDAVISPRAHIGEGVCVMAGAVVNVNATIGNNSIINTNCCIDHDCTIGTNCHIAPGVSLSGCVNVGDNVQIGTGASVIDNITIGKASYIGAGSAVVNDIPENVLAYGVPARKVRSIND